MFCSSLSGSQQDATWYGNQTKQSVFIIKGFSPHLQRHLYHRREIRVDEWERGSLFLKVPREKAEKSVWPAIKYFINHMFELYGVEVGFA